MDHHRILITVAAIILLVIGVCEIFLGLTRERERQEKDTGIFVERYALESGRDYGRLLHHATDIRKELAELIVAYKTSVGGACVILGFLLIAVLSDTRPRKPADTNEQSASTGEPPTT